MLGIIKKDLWESLLLKKNMLSHILAFLAIGVMLGTGFGGVATLMLFNGACFPLITVSTIQYSMEQDEISKFNDMLLTFPLTKKEIVLAKYLAGGIYSVGVLAVSLIITLFYVYGLQALDLKSGVLIWYIGVLMSGFFFAISAIGFFWLGNKKGTIMYIVMAVVGSFTYAFMSWNIDLSILMQLSVPSLMMIATVISVGVLILSYYVCLWLYSRKYS